VLGPFYVGDGVFRFRTGGDWRSATNGEAPHAQSARHDRVNRDAADSGERSIYANSEQSFAVTVEPYRARIPIGPEPIDLMKPPCPQHVKAAR
jgi:hypothetical protein